MGKGRGRGQGRLRKTTITAFGSTVRTRIVKTKKSSPIGAASSQTPQMEIEAHFDVEQGKKAHRSTMQADSGAGPKLASSPMEQYLADSKKIEQSCAQQTDLRSGAGGKVDANSASQPSQLSEMDIRMQSVGGKNKERVKGLGSLGRSVKKLKQSTSTLPEEIDEMIKSRVHASNVDLYAQLHEERCKNKMMRKELDLLKKHVYNASSSNE
ncbi:hypothetical protein HAX54_034337 [Datura stramonium]|uniref:Uncharacterized protein n=1 Tax=Datura stramonium TaxID=4076 RepID=A0ABS8SF20_DATST|nr:hypothetical protein [Datura stramonium]